MKSAPDTVLDRRLSAELERLHAANLYRVRRVVEGGHGALIVVEGRRCVNFCSNDYLGLAADPRLAQAARRALDHSGTGSGAAALVSGFNAEHARLEEELADFVGRPRALLFSTGWAANLGVLRALLGRDDTLIADELNHASLIDGGRLSGAHYLRIPHADMRSFENALAESSSANVLKLAVTDSVFSMDGDVADIPALASACGRHGAALMVDDAHGLGVIGDDGRGVLHHRFPPHPSPLTPHSIDVYVATLGKSLGAAGAFVAGSDDLIEFLIQRARSWVFSTAPPPAIAAAARAALGIVRAEPARRERLHANILRFRHGAAALGLALGIDTGSGAASVSTPIQPLVLGDAVRALAVSRVLFERGYWVAAIRPPTVPKGTSRLRITLSAAHTPEQIDGLLEALHAALATVAVSA